MNNDIPTTDQITHAIGALTLLRVWVANMPVEGKPDAQIHGLALASLDKADEHLDVLRTILLQKKG